jgi:hypothetical protein
MNATIDSPSSSAVEHPKARTATADGLREQWIEARHRLRGKGLFADGASLSLRCPQGATLWFGDAHCSVPARMGFAAAVASTDEAPLHAAIYLARPDVGAVLLGGGDYGRALVDFGGTMPQLFDEQARHIGPMGAPVTGTSALSRSLRTGGNALILGGRPACLGITCDRLVLNAELFEKCAKACVLALATGGSIQPLPWWVRLIANRRLMKDEKRAALRFSQGLMPEESRGY